jgi:hypothetical protein
MGGRGIVCRLVTHANMPQDGHKIGPDLTNFVDLAGLAPLMALWNGARENGYFAQYTAKIAQQRLDYCFL